VSQKRVNFETVELEIIKIDFDDIWQKYSKYSRIERIGERILKIGHTSDTTPYTCGQWGYYPLMIRHHFAANELRALVSLSLDFQFIYPASHDYLFNQFPIAFV